MAIRDDVDEMIAFLNELLEIDRDFIEAIVAKRFPCNAATAEHPTVQVMSDGPFRAGLLGILNGYFGAYDDGPHAGWGAIAASYSGNMLIKFMRTPNAI